LKRRESAFAYEADVANLHGTIQPRWTRVPQGMSVRRILACELSANDVTMCHYCIGGLGKQETLTAPPSVRIDYILSDNLLYEAVKSRRGQGWISGKSISPTSAHRNRSGPAP